MAVVGVTKVRERVKEALASKTAVSSEEVDQCVGEEEQAEKTRKKSRV